MRPGPRAGQKLDRRRNNKLDLLVRDAINAIYFPTYQRILEALHDRGERASHHEVEKTLRRLAERGTIRATGKWWEVVQSA